MTEQSGNRQRKRRSDGARSRDAILQEAARLATVEGLDGLSIARLADAVGMSKSGLFAHFDSKQDLQLATIETAAGIFAEEVTTPSHDGTTGLERLRLLADGFLRHVEGDTFPGGCFFASVAAEFDTRPGPVRDLAISVLNSWQQEILRAIQDAQAEGAIDAAEDAEQLTFEVNAYLLLGNAGFVVMHTPEPIERARRAVERRLEAALTQPAATARLT
jgi:AcrR family transcriptional regulator